MNQNLPTIINGTAGDDTLEGTLGIDLLLGFDGNDLLQGNEGHDFLFGHAGNDTLYGGEGHDYLLGGTGDDSLYGGEGSDILLGGEGNDRLYGGTGSDLLLGNDGNDLLFGAAGADFYDGGEGNDTVYFRENFAITADLNQGRATYINEAGVEVVETLIDIENLQGTAFDDHFIGDEGRNYLYGLQGNDTLIAGAGNDVLVGGTGVDFFDGGEGNDTVYFGDNFAITADLTQGYATYVNEAGVEIVETFIDIENLGGTAFDDQLIGDAGRNFLYGLQGNDTLIGGEGDDLLFGAAGADFYDGGEGNDTVYFRENFAITADLNQGRATYINEVGVEVVETLIDIENLQGTAFNDHFIGDEGRNFLYGLQGNDTLIAGAGNDVLVGGTGVDFYDGGEGNDAVYFGDNFAITADLTQGYATYVNEVGVEIVETFIDIENLGGTAFDDQLIGDKGRNFLYGLQGNDTLIGGEGDDLLFGAGGADFYDGGEGNDTVYFRENFAITANLSQGRATYVDEAGVEIVETLIDIENLQGTAFDDHFIGDEGRNYLYGLQGNDTLIGGAGNDNLRGGAGTDILDGGDGFDTAFFTHENFAIIADLNQETVTQTDDQGNTIIETIRDIERVYGTAFDDQLIGNQESNYLYGWDGNDTLLGGTANDYLHGNAGADTFAFSSPNQGIDTITDFNLAQADLIQVSASGFGGGLTVGTLDADQFTIGSAATNGSDRIIYNDATGALFFDPDGTGALGQVQFAQISTGLVLTNSDIFVV
ncbi:MAG: calcium-binding protein [Symploca sp. SIO2C1]|nr:calcium-binding protein [Symploca sp. SIO2C1]